MHCNCTRVQVEQGTGDVSVLMQALRDITVESFAATYPVLKTNFAALTGCSKCSCKISSHHRTFAHFHTRDGANFLQHLRCRHVAGDCRHHSRVDANSTRYLPLCHAATATCHLDGMLQKLFHFHSFNNKGLRGAQERTTGAHDVVAIVAMYNVYIVGLL